MNVTYKNTDCQLSWMQGNSGQLWHSTVVVFKPCLMSKLPKLGLQTENAGISWSDVIAFRSDSEVFLIFWS